jgi:hypothetical protein
MTRGIFVSIEQKLSESKVSNGRECKQFLDEICESADCNTTSRDQSNSQGLHLMGEIFGRKNTNSERLYGNVDFNGYKGATDNTYQIKLSMRLNFGGRIDNCRDQEIALALATELGIKVGVTNSNENSVKYFHFEYELTTEEPMKHLEKTRKSIRNLYVAKEAFLTYQTEKEEDVKTKALELLKMVEET